MIHVIATVELHSGARERFLSEFHKIVPDVRAEDGCIEYGAAVDVPSGLAAQIPLRFDDVVIVEKWSSVDALKAHARAAHLLAYRERTKAFVVRTTVQVLAPVDGRRDAAGS